jgi:hypothetical protein
VKTTPTAARITPAADPGTGPAWDITPLTRSRAGQITASIPAATARRTGPRHWTARILRPALAVTATTADASALTLTLDDAPAAGPLTLTFHPWTADDVMPLPPPELPAPGHLTIRDIRISTLMGRTVRYLIPAFTTA